MTRLYTTAEAAKEAGVTRQYIWQLVKAGRIKRLDAGTKYILIDQKELDRFLKEV